MRMHHLSLPPSPPREFHLNRTLLGVAELLGFIVLVALMARWANGIQRKWMESDRKAAELKAAQQTALEGGEDESEQLGLVETGGVDAEDGHKGGMPDVRRQLKLLRLDTYADAFEKHGFDYWPEILRLPPQRFAMMVESTGMSVNHAERLREQLACQRQAMGIKQAGWRRDDNPGSDSCAVL